MEWYEPSNFKDRIAEIEQFFIEIAANEEQLLAYGFGHALQLPGAETAIAGLKTFNEDFTALKRMMQHHDPSLAKDLELLDTNGKVLEQVALISLRIRMAGARSKVSVGLASINKILLILPYFSSLIRSRGLFGEEPVSLHKTIINLERMRGITASFADYITARHMADDEIFKPSNILAHRVVEQIESAILQIEAIESIDATEKDRLKAYLTEAGKEAGSENPSWSKVVGALVIVAAITSGLADAPQAAKTIKDTIEYILGSSIEKPLQKFLPPPTQAQKPPPGPRIVA